MDDKVKSKIDNCIKNFDFEKVCRVMNFLNWTWREAEDSPSIGELVLYVQRHLTDCFDRLDLNKEEDKYTIDCGGFKILAFREKDEIDFEIYFILAEWETYR